MSTRCIVVLLIRLYCNVTWFMKAATSHAARECKLQERASLGIRRLGRRHFIEIVCQDMVSSVPQGSAADRPLAPRRAISVKNEEKYNAQIILLSSVNCKLAFFYNTHFHSVSENNFRCFFFFFFIIR